MERLIKDANEWAKANGKAANLSIENFSDVVTAIDYIQQKQNIANTTAREAGSTIAGSFGAMKAAWDNLVTGFADPKADLGQLITDFTTAASTALANAVPTVVKALGGIATAVEKLAPIIGEKLPELIEQVLPPLLNAASSLVQSIASALPDLIKIISDALPSVLNTLIPVAMEALITVVSAISNALPQILKIIEDNIDVISNGIFTVVSAIGMMILQALPTLADMVVKWLPKALEFVQRNMSKFTSAIGKIVKTVGTMIVKLAPVIFPMLIDIGKDLIKSLTEGVTNNSSEAVSGILTVIEAIINTLLDPNTLLTIMNCGLQILLALISGIADNMDKIMDLVFLLVENLIAFVVLAIPDLVEGIGKAGAKVVTEVIPKIILKLGEKFGDILDWLLGEDGVLGWIPKMINGCIELGKGIWSGMWSGISSMWESVIGVGSKVVGWIVSGVTNAIDKLKELGVKMVKKVVEGIKSVRHWIEDALMGSGVSDWLEEKMEQTGEAGADGYVSGQEKGFDIHSPSRKMERIGQMVMAGFNKGIEEEDEPTFGEVAKVNMDALTSKGVKSNMGGILGVQTDRMNDLLSMLTQIMNNGQETVIPVYIGGHQIEEILVDGKNRIVTRSGGQVNV